MFSKLQSTKKILAEASHLFIYGNKLFLLTNFWFRVIMRESLLTLLFDILIYNFF